MNQHDNLFGFEYGNEVDDDQLLAELDDLIAGETETKQNSNQRSSSAKTTTGSGKVGTGGAQDKKPKDTNNDDDEMDGDDGMDDDDYLDELMGLCSEEQIEKNQKTLADTEGSTQKSENIVIKRAEAIVDVEHGTLSALSNEQLQRSTYVETIEPNYNQEQQQQMLEKSRAGDKTNKPAEQNQEPRSESVPENLSLKARSILLRRRELYQNNSSSAQNAQDTKSAAEFIAIVKLFDSALEAVDNGAVLTDDDLKEIPSSPPPYKPSILLKNVEPRTLLEELEIRMNRYKELVESAKKSGDERNSRMNKRLMDRYVETIALYKKKRPIDWKSLPNPPGCSEIDLAKYSAEIAPQSQNQQQQLTKSTAKPDIIQKHETDKAIDTAKSFVSDQHKLVVTRQNKLKKAALEAKQGGKIEAAKDFLSKAKSIDQMVIAAKGGLPVDIKSLPMMPVYKQQLQMPAAKINSQLGKLFSELGGHLGRQIDHCQSMMTSFQERSDAKSVILYESLLNSSQEDLKKLQTMATTCKEAPRYKLTELKLPIIELNPNIPDNALDFKISLKNVKLPEGWQPADCYLFVSYEFPFPRESHQTGKTSVVKGTNSPEYPALRVSINRSPQLLRICKRAHLKLEIYQKGGFLRSDKLFGHADIPLARLEDAAGVNDHFEILDGRKKTGGMVDMEIRISKPLGQGKGTGVAMRKWITLQ